MSLVASVFNYRFMLFTVSCYLFRCDSRYHFHLYLYCSLRFNLHFHSQVPLALLLFFYFNLLLHCTLSLALSLCIAPTSPHAAIDTLIGRTNMTLPNLRKHEVHVFITDERNNIPYQKHSIWIMAHSFFASASKHACWGWHDYTMSFQHDHFQDIMNVEIAVEWL